MLGFATFIEEYPSLDVTYKVLASVLKEVQLERTIDSQIGEHQTGFRKTRTTVPILRMNEK